MTAVVVIIIIIIIIIIHVTRVGQPSRTMHLPWLLGYLHFEVPDKANELLMLLYSWLS